MVSFDHREPGTAPEAWTAFLDTVDARPVDLTGSAAVLVVAPVAAYAALGPDRQGPPVVVATAPGTPSPSTAASPCAVATKLSPTGRPSTSPIGTVRFG